jgi:exonuclease III
MYHSTVCTYTPLLLIVVVGGGWWDVRLLFCSIVVLFDVRCSIVVLFDVRWMLLWSVVGIIHYCLVIFSFMRMTESPNAKRLKTSTKSSPTSIVTWNCNGFIPRCKYNPELLHAMVLEETLEPDMICIQEARVKAASNQERGTPQASEYQGPVETALTKTFRNYQEPYWSLAETRYAGTLTLIHKRLLAPQVAFSVDSAIDLLLEKYQLTRTQVDLPLILENHQKQQQQKQQDKKKQTSIHSFFSATTNKAASSNTNTNNTTTTKQNEQHQQHHEEGRFQFFAFPNMDILQTYVPNHGIKPDKWDKRKRWDLQLEQFLLQRQRLLLKKRTKSRPFVWCGDLNVAHCYTDGTHWSRKKKDDGIYEWWTDERKCLVGPAPPLPKDPQHVGMPSFTPVERTRVTKLWQVGKLVDVWRQLHPTPSSNWDDPHWTWKGKGKLYGNKGQRIDYFLIDCSNIVAVQEAVESCEILGYGDRKGLFCGSDHCVSLLKLKGELS